MTIAVVMYLGLLLARLGSFVGVMPLFSARIPRLVKVGFAVALAAFYLGNAAPGWEPGLIAQAGEVSAVVYALAIGREMLIGLALGVAFSLFLLPARVAGEFVTHQVGLNITPENSAVGESGGVVTNVFETIAGLVFLVADGHHVVLSVMHASFARFPLGGGALPEAGGGMIAGLQSAYEMGLLLAGPLTLCLLLLSVTLAVMARTAPQLNVYSVGFTLQVMVVLFGGVFLLPEFVLTLHAIIDRTGGVLTGAMGG